jgi:hypothetical protein
MRVTIPDELGDALLAKLPKAQTLDGEVTRLLSFCAPLAAGETPILLQAPQITELARHLGREASVRSYTDILAGVDRLAALSFGHLRFEFSAGQLIELERRASREQMSVVEYSARVLRSLTSQFFQTLPAREEWPQLMGADADELSLGNLGIPNEAGDDLQVVD